MRTRSSRGGRSWPIWAALLGGCVQFEAPGGEESSTTTPQVSATSSGPTGDDGSLADASAPTGELPTGDPTNTTGEPPTSDATTPGEPPTSDPTGVGELTGEPPGTGLGPSVVSSVWAFDAMDIGDVDGDGLADLVTSGAGQPPRLTVYLGRADGSFDATAPAISEVASFTEFVLADVTGDGRADALARGAGAPPRVTLYAADDGALFEPRATTPVFDFTHMHAADLDDDGLADLLTGTGDGQPPQVWVWPGQPDSIGDAPLHSAELWRYDVLRAADVDGDGLSDVVTASAGAPPRLSVHPGDGAGGFGEAIIADIFNFAWLDLGDLDGDGLADAATDVPGNAWRIQLYRALPGAQWSAPLVHDGHNFAGFQHGDVNGDGRDDLITRPTGEPPRVEVYLAAP